VTGLMDVNRVGDGQLPLLTSASDDLCVLVVHSGCTRCTATSSFDV
jgi:hypothetical protein